MTVLATVVVVYAIMHVESHELHMGVSCSAEIAYSSCHAALAIG